MENRDSKTTKMIKEKMIQIRNKIMMEKFQLKKEGADGSNTSISQNGTRKSITNTKKKLKRMMMKMMMRKDREFHKPLILINKTIKIGI